MKRLLGTLSRKRTTTLALEASSSLVNHPPTSPVAPVTNTVRPFQKAWFITLAPRCSPSWSFHKHLRRHRQQNFPREERRHSKSAPALPGPYSYPLISRSPCDDKRTARPSRPVWVRPELQGPVRPIE